MKKCLTLSIFSLIIFLVGCSASEKEPVQSLQSSEEQTVGDKTKKGTSKEEPASTSNKVTTEDNETEPTQEVVLPEKQPSSTENVQTDVPASNVNEIQQKPSVESLDLDSYLGRWYNTEPSPEGVVEANASLMVEKLPGEGNEGLIISAKMEDDSWLNIATVNPDENGYVTYLSEDGTFSETIIFGKDPITSELTIEFRSQSTDPNIGHVDRAIFKRVFEGTY